MKEENKTIIDNSNIINLEVLNGNNLHIIFIRYSKAKNKYFLMVSGSNIKIRDRLKIDCDNYELMNLVQNRIISLNKKFKLELYLEHIICKQNGKMHFK